MESTMIGRDPAMDRAIARVARHLYELEQSTCADLTVAHHLKLAARRLWAAAKNLPPVSKQLVQPTIRVFIIVCKEAEHDVRIGRAVAVQNVHQAFATLVSDYRITRLEFQADAYPRTNEAGA